MTHSEKKKAHTQTVSCLYHTSQPTQGKDTVNFNTTNLAPKLFNRLAPSQSRGVSLALPPVLATQS